MLVNQASTSTTTEESKTTSPNQNNQNTDKIALKLNRLKDKSAMYVTPGVSYSLI